MWSTVCTTTWMHRCSFHKFLNSFVLSSKSQIQSPCLLIDRIRLYAYCTAKQQLTLGMNQRFQTTVEGHNDMLLRKPAWICASYFSETDRAGINGGDLSLNAAISMIIVVSVIVSIL